MYSESRRKGSADGPKSDNASRASWCCSLASAFAWSQSKQSRIGRFVLGGIGALLFSQGLGIALDVENVITDLKGKTNRHRVLCQLIPTWRVLRPPRNGRPRGRWHGSRLPSCAGACCVARRWSTCGRTAARSIAWPPAMPYGAARLREHSHHLGHLARSNGRCLTQG